MKTVLQLFIFLSATNVFGGAMDTGGGDWFVHPIPVLQQKLSQDPSNIDGVIYKKFKIPRCPDGESKMFSVRSFTTTAHFAGANWEAYEAKIRFGSIECSYGVAESDPVKALALLAGIKQGDVYALDEKTILYSKSRWNTLVMGPYLFFKDKNEYRIFSFYQRDYKLSAPIEDPRFFTYYPNWRQQGKAALYDEIYLPQKIEKERYSYFGYMVEGRWSVVLPVALSERDFPLVEFADNMLNSAEEKQLFSPVTGPNETYATEASVAAVVWSNFHQTSVQRRLRKELGEKVGMDLSQRHPGYWDVHYLPKDLLTFSFMPAVGDGDLTKAHYHKVGSRNNILIPVENPTWHVTGDVVHELTHVIQSYTVTENSESQTFQNEMEANLNVSAHFDELEQSYPILNLARPLFNYTIAALVPNLVWAEKVEPVAKRPLCDEVIAAYNLNRNKIDKAVLNKFECK